MRNLNLKKTFLYTLIGSITLSGLMGIWAILVGEFGDFQGKILGTTLTVVGTSILGLACGAFWESPKSANSSLKIVPIGGIILSFVAAITLLIMIWAQIDDIWKTFAVSGIFAFSLAQLSLLSLANLSKRFEWVLTALFFVVLVLASIVSILIIIEPSSENDFVMRLIGVLAVTDAALTVMIPIFHRLSRGDFSEKEVTVENLDEKIAELQKQINKLETQKEELLKGEN